MPDILTLTSEAVVGVIRIDSPPVNALGVCVRRALRDGLATFLDDKDISAIVIICGGRTFFAGADISEFGKPPEEPELRTIFEEIECAAKPVIAAIHGTALGGGYELALVCHHRIAVPSAVVGLPEIKLGLIPGGGGTQRLPRIVGVETALDLITSGRSVPAKEAQRIGMIDALAREGHLREDAIGFARLAIGADKSTLGNGHRQPKIRLVGETMDVLDQFHASHAQQYRGIPAFDAVLEAIRAAVELPIAQGLKREWCLFTELEKSIESEALRYIFFSERASARIPGVPSNTSACSVNSVGIVGAGTGGTSIAVEFLRGGISVRLTDPDNTALERANRDILSAFDAENGTSADKKLAPRFQTSADIGTLEDADLIVATTDGEPAERKKLFSTIARLAKPEAIIACSSSLINLIELAEAADRPEAAIGLHFVRSHQGSRLLEIGRTTSTSEKVLSTALQLARRLNRTPIVSCSTSGSIVNRLLRQLSAEAEALTDEGVLPERMDQVLTGFGFPSGLPGRFEHGWRGNAVCSGPACGIRDEDILERLLYPLINEGARLLEEQVALRASDIDLAAVLGCDWPRHRGGPMFWADTIGLPRVVDKLRSFQRIHGRRFELSTYLVGVMKRGQTLVRPSSGQDSAKNDMTSKA